MESGLSIENHWYLIALIRNDTQYDFKFNAFQAFISISCENSKFIKPCKELQHLDNA